MNRILISLLVGACCFAALSCGEETPPTTSYDVAAFVWPAYHNDPRFAEIGIFPDGVGEWEAIYKARPKFDGHCQPRIPLWGYLDEADPQVQEFKIRTALEYGINTFIFDWYWYDDRPFLEDVLNKGFLQARNNRQMKFYLMWANHVMTSYLDAADPDKGKVYWPAPVTPEVFDRITDHLIHDYFKLPNYYKIDGKPVFAIYETSTFIREMGGEEQAVAALDHFRRKCIDAGLPGVHLQPILWFQLPATPAEGSEEASVSRQNTVRRFGFESLTNYQWCHFVPADQDYEAWGEQATACYEMFDREFDIPYFPHVSIGWDPNPRYPEATQPCVTGSTPARFETFLRRAKKYVDTHPDQPHLITINAWNEWAESSYLEPDSLSGYGYLEAVKRVFKISEQ